jgi:hypothetical protein
MTAQVVDPGPLYIDFPSFSNLNVFNCWVIYELVVNYVVETSFNISVRYCMYEGSMISRSKALVSLHTAWTAQVQILLLPYFLNKTEENVFERQADSFLEKKWP